MNQREDVFNDHLLKAIALFFDGKTAPTVSASGINHDAETIIKLAEKHKVPLFSNPALVTLLENLKVNEEIPENTYVAVAQLISFAYKLEMSQTTEDGSSAACDSKEQD